MRGDDRSFHAFFIVSGGFGMCACFPFGDWAFGEQLTPAHYGNG